MFITMKKFDIKALKDKQRGSFVLEALISILLFSIGILAIVGLQAASIANAASAKDRTVASLLANQIIGQMWVADKTNATLAANFCGGPSAGSAVCAAPAVAVACAAAGASYSSWAASSVAATLPGISIAAAANLPTIALCSDNTATVTVNWQAPKDIAPHNYSIAATIND
jgi:type IV pilus assembly protein PilV